MPGTARPTRANRDDPAPGPYWLGAGRGCREDLMRFANTKLMLLSLGLRFPRSASPSCSLRPPTPAKEASSPVPMSGSATRRARRSCPATRRPRTWSVGRDAESRVRSCSVSTLIRSFGRSFCATRAGISAAAINKSCGRRNRKGHVAAAKIRGALKQPPRSPALVRDFRARVTRLAQLGPSGLRPDPGGSCDNVGHRISGGVQ